MEWTDLLVAVSLVLVIEGLMPFISPRGFKNTMMQIASLSDSSVRNIGAISMLLGLIMLYVVR